MSSNADESSTGPGSRKRPHDAFAGAAANSQSAEHPLAPAGAHQPPPLPHPHLHAVAMTNAAPLAYILPHPHRHGVQAVPPPGASSSAPAGAGAMHPPEHHLHPHGSYRPGTGHLPHPPAAAPAVTAPPVAPPPPPPPIVPSGKHHSKGYNGLRQFSMMVCKKVEEKGTTTYNEVADELVMQVMEEKQQQPQVATLDEKNIRRRVYDALNVLMAMDIITKDKKAITWKGLPTSARQDLDLLGRERDFRAAELQKKRQQLQDLIIQQVCFRNLTARNAQLGDVEPSQKIPLPFIIVNTHSSAVIQCNMSKDLTDVMFDFSMPFEINDDNTILKRLGMYGF